jgi:predicted enzyme related to lactoylglutathione lyase
MASRDGKDVAALFESHQQGPPHWNCYVSVESADATAALATELGATLAAEPFDVLDVGRMAVIVDPEGAALAVWEAGTHIGASLVNTPGSLSWNDLLTPDPEASTRFYGDLFGWTTKEMQGGEGYRVIYNGEAGNGGMLPLRPEMGPTPPNWMPYFGHEDVERLAKEIGGLGGQLFNGPMPLPQGTDGTIAVFGDPQGAAFAVFTGEFDD